MRVKAEKYSKASYVEICKKSRFVINRWLENLKNNAVLFSERWKNTEYLCFLEYDPSQKNLTPRQHKIFLEHYGYDDPYKE